jgi:hypothetical protein
LPDSDSPRPVETDIFDEDLAAPAQVRRQTRAWTEAALWGLVIITLTTLPTLLATTVVDRVVIERSLFHAHDVPQFLAAIDEGRTDGAWLLTDRFTAEPHAPAFVYPAYLALGHLAALVGVGDAVAYHAAALVSRIALWIALATLIARLLPLTRQRRWAYLLLCVSGGFISSFAVVGALLALGQDTSSYLPPVPSLLTVMLGPPHWALGLTALIALLLVLCGLEQWQGPKPLLGIAGCIVALGVVYPFLLTVALTMIALAYGYVWYGTRRWRTVAGGLALSAALAFPFVFYNLLLFSLDPFWSAVYGASQNHMPSPPLWFLPIYLGVVSVPGAWAAVRWWRGGSFAARIVVLGLVGMLVWMYLPVSFQRRSGLAGEPLLAVLAASVIAQGWLARSAWRRTLLSIGLADSAAMLVFIFAAAFGQGPWPSQGLPAGEARLAEWLAPQVAADQLVLAPPEFSAFLASRSHGRVAYADAGTSTRDYEHKQGLVTAYYAPQTSAGRRSELEVSLGYPDWLVAPESQVMVDPRWGRWQSGGGLVVYRRLSLMGSAHSTTE